MTGVFAWLVGQMLETVEPFVDAAGDPDRLAHILEAVDANDPRLDHGNLIPALGTISTAIAELKTSADATDWSTDEIGRLLDALARIIEGIQGLSSAAASDYPALGEDLLNMALVERLRFELPVAFQLANAFGIVETTVLPEIRKGGVLLRPSRPSTRFMTERFGAFLNNPIKLLTRDLPASPLATTADAQRTADTLALRWGGTFSALSLPWAYGYDPADDALLGDLAPDFAHSFVFFLPDNLVPNAQAGVAIRLSAADADDLGVVLAPFGTLAVTAHAGPWSIDITASAEIDGLIFGGGAGTEIIDDDGAGTYLAQVVVRPEISEEVTALVLGDPAGTRFEFGAPSLTAGIASSAGKFDVSVTGATGQSALVVASADGDGFLASILPPDGAKVNFDLALGWSLLGGITFKGGAGLSLRIPIGRSIGGITLTDCFIGLTAGSGVLTGEASISVKASLGPVTASVDRLGMTAALDTNAGHGSIGLADFDYGFKYPSGIGISVEAKGLVTGGGFLFHDDARSLYAGVLQLSLQETVTLKAVGLIGTTLPDGSPGYSLLILITAEDFGSIQLPMGFTLEAIGGLIAINRTFDEDALRTGLSSGMLERILFPHDPVGNASAVISALSAAFPAKRGAYLIGVMARLGWFTPTLIHFEVALALEFGSRRRLLILGRVSSLLPSADNDLVRINLDAIGVIDFDQGTAAIDAVLVDSRLAHKYALTGAMALRARWSDGPGSSFILAVGGLNPRFTPPPNLPPLRRISIELCSGDNPRLTCQAYFAITSNTLQFGAHASLHASAYGFSVDGDVGFDVLIQYRPLHFIADFSASLQLKHGSHNLFKVSFSGTLEGPQPLHVKGRASFEICWCDFSVGFDKTLVSGEALPPPLAVDLSATLRSALADPANWASEPGDHGVTLRPLPTGAPFTADPVGRLSVRQHVAPLNLTRDIDLFAGAPVTGERRFAVVASIEGQSDPGTPITEQFAPSQYFSLSDAEKLSGPSFEAMTAGLAIDSGGATFDSGNLVAAPLEFDEHIIDTRPPPPPVRRPFGVDFLDAALISGPAARAPLRTRGPQRFRVSAADTAVTVRDTAWTVASMENRTPVPNAVHGSWSEATAAAQSLNAGTTRWQLVRAYEADA